MEAKNFLLGLFIGGSVMSFASGEGGYEKSDFYKTMGKKEKAAVLMVHFGTTFDETRGKTIDVLNKDAKKEFSNLEVREAYTSRIIMRRLKERNILKDNPAEALDKLKAEGYTHLLVQSSNVIPGIEFKTLEKQLELYKDSFKEIRMGDPLLNSVEDYKNVADVLNKEIGPLKENEAVVFVGHGTHDSGNASYPCMDYMSKSLGYKFYFGTVEGFPTIDNVITNLKKDGIKEIKLLPFMFVAGDHANNDIAEDWKNSLEENGFKVSVEIKGLGEYREIREILISHLKLMTTHKEEDMISKKIFYSNEKD